MHIWTMRIFLFSILTTFSLLGSSCSENAQYQQSPKINASADHVQTETRRLDDWFDDRYQESLMRSPIRQSYHGSKTGNDKLDDVSRAARDEEYALHLRWLSDMKREFNFERLNAQGKLSYRLFEFFVDDAKMLKEFDELEYVFTPISGAHLEFPAFLIEHHAIEDLDDARAYIARLNESGRYLGQFKARAVDQAESGILLPKFGYAQLIETTQDMLKGAPFDGGADSALLRDFKSKISELSLDAESMDGLISQAEEALLNSLQPTCEALIEMFIAQESQAGTEDGIWRMSDGETRYQYFLNIFATTSKDPEEIHAMGVEQVALFKKELENIAEPSVRGMSSKPDSIETLVPNSTLPLFRMNTLSLSFNEGWVLYAGNPKFVSPDPLVADRIDEYWTSLLYHAVALVADTGIHAKKWTREQAVQYITENTSRPEADIRKDVDGIIFQPGRAIAPLAGMLKFEELEQKARTELGDNFDLAKFYNVLLENGSLPLPLLEETVTEWITNKSI